MALNLQLWVTNNETDISYGIPALTEQVTYTSTRNIEASTLSFSVVGDDRVKLGVGYTVRYIVDGQGVFMGVINKLERDQTGLTKVEAVDQLWYAKAKVARIFEDKTAGEVVAALCAEFGLQVGRIDDTSYRQTWMYTEEKSVQDIMNDVINQTIRATGRVWCLYDNFGGLCLTEPTALATNVIVGDQSLAYKYNYTVDIKETYNKIKLVRPNKDTGRTDVYLFENTASFATWGCLQLYEKVDENLTESEIRTLGKEMLDYYCAEKREIKVSALGVVGIRAGSLVHIAFEDIELSRKLLIEKAVHKFKNCDHTMELQARVI